MLQQPLDHTVHGVRHVLLNKILLNLDTKILRSLGSKILTKIPLNLDATILHSPDSKNLTRLDARILHRLASEVPPLAHHAICAYNVVLEDATGGWILRVQCQKGACSS